MLAHWDWVAIVQLILTLGGIVVAVMNIRGNIATTQAVLLEKHDTLSRRFDEKVDVLDRRMDDYVTRISAHEEHDRATFSSLQAQFNSLTGEVQRMMGREEGKVLASGGNIQTRKGER